MGRKNGRVKPPGELWLSVSQAKQLETDKDGCERQWWFERVLHKPKKKSKAMDLGSECATHMENLYLHGEMPPRTKSGTIFNAAVPLLPRPDPAHAGILVPEKEIFFYLQPGIAVIGYEDLSDHRAKTPHYWDLKTTKTFDYALTSATLVRDLQFQVYGAEEMRTTGASEAKGNWVYSKTEGASRAYTVPATCTKIVGDTGYERLHKAAAIASRLRVINNVLDVPASPSQCNKFGGCAHRAYCKLPGRSFAASFLGASMGLRDRAATAAPATQQRPAAPARTATSVQRAAPARRPAPEPVQEEIEYTDEDQVYPPDEAQSPDDLPPEEEQAPAPKAKRGRPPKGSPVAAESPAKRAPPKAAPQTPVEHEQPEPMHEGPTLLFVDCAVVRGAYPGAVHLSELIGNDTRVTDPESGIVYTDFRCAPFGRGAGLLAEAFKAAYPSDQLPAAIIADTSIESHAACLDYLTATCGTVIRGARPWRF